MNEISDGKKYSSSDKVSMTCGTCEGCSSCCRTSGDTIVLDPWDIHNLCAATGMSFRELVNRSFVELGTVDRIKQPHLFLNDDGSGCVFLNEKTERCMIHDLRPGICRLFPLGRLYEDKSFYYFYQKNECVKKGPESPVLVSEWLGIKDLPNYEDFILKWHIYIKKARKYMEYASDEERRRFNMKFIKHFYMKSYEPSFYESALLRIKDGETFLVNSLN